VHLPVPLGPRRPGPAAPAPASPYDGPVTPRLRAALAGLPEHPGVYLMRDAEGKVLYVGKAQSLRARVRQYWQASRGTAPPMRIESAIERVADLEWTLTDTVSEALVLEATLVKKHQPPFNVRLKDDKSYPWIRVTLGDDFPRIERTRRVVADGSRYFGPYASASSVDEAMDRIRRIFPFRTCTIAIAEGERALDRPCLLYHIKRCQGPCIEAIDRAAYRADIDRVMGFLDGRQEQVARDLRAEMEAAAESLAFERAASLRDTVRAIERTMEAQKMAGFRRSHLDVLGFARSRSEAAVQLFAVREGRTVSRDVHQLENLGEESDAAALAAFVSQYYATASSIPPRVLLPFPAPEPDLLAALLSDRRGSRVRLEVPQRGTGRRLADLAGRNAAAALAREQARRMTDTARTRGALDELAAALGLVGPPARIECYDISTIQGTSTVGSMVVAEDGRPTPAEYRRFRIRTVAGQDDFRSHQEVLRRRFGRVLAAEEGSADAERWRLPDLVLIDGGKGQVSHAAEVLAELGLGALPLAGIAKEREELFLPGRAEPVILPPTSAGLYLVTRLRDEAHRFAITYHRTVRARAQTRSALDGIPGVGPARRRALLRAFGSAAGVRAATTAEIAGVDGIGPAMAERIRAWLDA